MEQYKKYVISLYLFGQLSVLGAGGRVFSHLAACPIYGFGLLPLCLRRGFHA
ncbi:hypothetical protein [Thermosyntropha sp.]|uniref:hypothetical protein n=1 Tax=Thermosyntropha sp. TaxID=2740820 RepID=UPI0025F8056C|nr:hypothetical protein [Thermosyntropha sp.]MBO8159263.1 hypothetical protein [Thermosyntropha sp.]